MFKLHKYLFTKWNLINSNFVAGLVRETIIPTKYDLRERVSKNLRVFLRVFFYMRVSRL